ncbi:MAG: T9SS type A sorting domain-containing protein [Bacteroidales bacterium]|nr:T9SS type A sorting domain-containing protein [Bacteroidales bacterium]
MKHIFTTLVILTICISQIFAQLSILNEQNETISGTTIKIASNQESNIIFKVKNTGSSTLNGLKAFLYTNGTEANNHTDAEFSFCINGSCGLNGACPSFNLNTNEEMEIHLTITPLAATNFVVKVHPDGESSPESTFNLLALTPHVVNINYNNGGTVSPSISSQTVLEGDNFTFTVNPDNCHTIGTITVNGNDVNLDQNNSYTITNITENQNISITFNPYVYTITASAGDNGTIDPIGDINVNCGESKTFTMTPNEGYEVADVIVDDQSIGATNSYTFNNVTENGHRIEAQFKRICYAVSDLNVEINDDGNLLTWTAIEYAESYNIYRNGTLVSSNNTSTTYLDTDGGVGIEYYIVTNCEDGNTSNPSATINAGIKENLISLEIYPNPTNSKLTIKCENMIATEIYNPLGQLVFTIETDSDTLDIDSSAWPAGVYSIKITTIDLYATRQIIKL